jgi:3-oxoacyl-[acyl-carrier-protein] synthase III
MGSGILGIGVYLPEKRLTNEDLSRRFKRSSDEIFALCGIRERPVAAPGQSCADMTIAAAKQALDDAGTTPDEIGMVVVATNTGDYPTPSTAALVQAALGIPSAGCFDLKANCTGFVYGLQVGCSLVSSGVVRKVLLAGSEVLTRSLHPGDSDCLMLFGDGAGAVIIGEVPDGYGLIASSSGTNGAEHASLMIPVGGSRMPSSHETLAGNQQYLQMNGGAVFMFAMRVLGDSALQVIQNAGLSVDDIARFLPHQANHRIIEAAARRLDLPIDRFVIDMENTGNLAAASLPVLLYKSLEKKLIRHGDLLVFTGFGAGLSWGSVLMKWHSQE